MTIYSAVPSGSKKPTIVWEESQEEELKDNFLGRKKNNKVVLSLRRALYELLCQRQTINCLKAINIDPLGRPTVMLVVIIVFVHVVRPSVPTFQNLTNQNKFQAKTMFATGEPVGLAKWIINCLKAIDIALIIM